MITNQEITAITISKLAEMLTDCAPDFMSHAPDIQPVWTTINRLGTTDTILTYQICVYNLPLKIFEKYGIDVSQDVIKNANGTVTNLYLRWKAAKKV